MREAYGRRHFFLLLDIATLCDIKPEYWVMRFAEGLVDRSVALDRAARWIIDCT